MSEQKLTKNDQKNLPEQKAVSHTTDVPRRN